MAITFTAPNFIVAQNTLLAGAGTISSAATTVKLGTFTVPASLVTGVGTSFTTALVVGSMVWPATGDGILVHTITSNTSFIGFRNNNTNNVLTLAAGTTFQTVLPNTFAELLTAVALQSATVAQGNTTAINFVASSLTINTNTVLIMPNSVALTFGNSAGFRLNNSNGTLIFRNGGSITYTGNTSHSFFNGFLNVWNGELDYQAHMPNIVGARIDFFSPSTKSNGISACNIIYSTADNGTNLTNAFWFTHLEPLAGKFGALKFTNACSRANTGSLNVQFGDGIYENASLPKVTSTFGIAMTVNVYLGRSGGTTTLIKPQLPDSTLRLSGDTAGAGRLVDEQWIDLAVGTLGTITRDLVFPGNTTVTRVFTYTPGTLFNANPVYLRIANAVGTVAINGAVTSANAIELPWQTYNTSTNVTTNFSPFSLVARRANMPEITASFTPTAPIVFSAPLVTDTYFTSDASAQTGISAVNNATKTVTISAGTTLTIDRRYDFLKHYLTQNLTVANFLSPVGTVLNYLLGWSDVVNGTSNSGTKLVTTSTTGTVTIGASGLVNHAFIDANQVGFITAEGSSGNTVELRNTSTNAVIRSRTGDGLITVAPADVGVSVYLARISGGNVVGSSVLTPVTLIAGNNGVVKLYFGNAVQVANIDAINAALAATLTLPQFLALQN